MWVSAGSCAGGSASVSERQRWSATDSEGPREQGFWTGGRDGIQSSLKRQNQTSQTFRGEALIETSHPVFTEQLSMCSGVYLL